MPCRIIPTVPIGLMFMTKKWDGSPMDMDYAETRMRNEPIVEMTQVKGDSETHPLLSPNGMNLPISKPCRFVSGHGSKASPTVLMCAKPICAASKWRRRAKAIPIASGIGASDTHVGAGAFDEDNYWSKSAWSIPMRACAARCRRNNRTLTARLIISIISTLGASGLAAVWAD